jgi:plastocyanin
MAGDATPGTGTPAAVRTVEVVIERFVYEPRRIEVAPGTRVVWTNRDGAPHTVTIPGDFDSGRISKGGTYERVFTEPGSYLYECFYHQNMTGRVVVVPVAASPEASPVS